MKRELRTPPHSIEAEECIIASFLLDGRETIDLCTSAGITADSFYDVAHRTMWEAAVNIVASNRTLDAVIFCEELKKAGLLEAVGGIVRIDKITNRTPTTAHRSYFIEEVKNCATRRQLIAGATQAIEAAYENTGDVSSLLDATQSKFMSLTLSGATESASAMSEVTDLVGKMVEEMIKGGGIQSGVRTGFIDIDNLTFGLQPCEMTILAARPSCGKTALALNIAQNIAAKDNVLFYNLEMDKKQLGLRMLTATAKVRSDRLKRGQVGSDGEALDRLRRAYGEMKRVHLFIDDNSFQTVATIRAKTRSLHHKLKDSGGLKAVFIDYLQLIASTNTKANREVQVSEMSRGLKLMAKELGIPVVVLCQLNRASEMNNRQPRLYDLRESGSLEQDADCVWLLSPDDLKKDDNKRVAADVMRLSVAKQRNGEVADIKLTFEREITKFENYAGQF